MRMNPPLWVLRQTILPYGARLPKKKPLWEPPKKIYTFNYEPSKEGFSVDKGNLPNDEYRYWIGCRSEAANWATCRFCKSHVESKEARKAHKEHGCCKLLESCYSLLLRDHLCVICDTRTDRKKWGVPLCSEACEMKWKFDAYYLAALEHAMKIVAKV